MNSGQRFAGLLGVIFPVLALVVFSVVLSLTHRAAAPSGAPGQTSMSSQTTAQSGGNTSGMGLGSSSGTGTAGNPSSTTAMAGSGAPTGMAAGGSGAAATPGAAPTGAQGVQPTAVQVKADGAQVYSGNCASCHGPVGAGVAGAFPPLAGNKAILGSEKYVSDVLLYGLQGQINVAGQPYNGVMPAWAAVLSDAQIAAVLTHIRSSWGNSAPAVTAATVKTERATPLTVAQVLAERPQ
ncbi:c-type cytochrome [Deinococcus sp.]|uniref:c-type cytochrome n=1 Tax=Deinococcus sp. TaxID=47478 RepID=UPI003C7A4B87